MNGVHGTGVVVIGRDLGARLEPCLRSIAAGPPRVYVDSASSDGSDRVAAALGFDVVRLDAATALSASRGRNAGVEHLLRAHPGLESVQFVDGDCRLEPSWIEAAADAMRGDPTLAVVCGHVREKDAEGSVASTLLDADWRGPVGEVPACGGIFLVRAAAFAQVGGFRTEMTAWEEADLCARLRERRWRVLRLDRPMCEHDAGIRTIGGWWRRTVRVGHATAALRTRSNDPAMARRFRSVLVWTVVLPLLAVAGAVAAFRWPAALLLPAGVLALHVLQVFRVAARQRREGRSPRAARLYGLFNLVAKWGHLVGSLRFWTGR